MADELALLSNASACIEQIANAGKPADPLDFPEPIVQRAVRVRATVYDPSTGQEVSVPNVIYQLDYQEQTLQQQPHHNAPMKAYWIGRKLKKAIYGCVRSCTILRPRHIFQEDEKKGNVSTSTAPSVSNDNNPSSLTSWEVTSEMGAVKIIEWNALQTYKEKSAEDPIKEISAMQYINKNGNHQNLIYAYDVLADDQYLYIFMPFCSRGELFSFVERDGRFSEPVARYWFRQILNGLYHLQRNGICHRDLSLENILVNKNTNCLVIDLGMSLRVPFGADDGTITDVSNGSFRRLIKPQGQCGKPNYISPEVLQNDGPFDGYAIDVWAAGIILFIMLVGLPPFDWAHDDDPRFRMITRGNLREMLAQWNRNISCEAMELLQSMLQKEPRDRLSLMEVMDHRWVVTEPAFPPEIPERTDWYE